MINPVIIVVLSAKIEYVLSIRGLQSKVELLRSKDVSRLFQGQCLQMQVICGKN